MFLIEQIDHNLVQQGQKFGNNFAVLGTHAHQSAFVAASDFDVRALVSIGMQEVAELCFPDIELSMRFFILLQVLG